MIFLKKKWDIAVKGVVFIVALLTILFLNGFGAFYNFYWLLLGWYITLAGLDINERRCKANTFPIIIGPYGLETANVVKAIKTMRK